MDKGEPAKIAAQIREAETSLDRELAPVGAPRQYGMEQTRVAGPYDRRDQQYHDRRYADDHHAYSDHKGYKYRKKSKFESLFDIFDQK